MLLATILLFHSFHSVLFHSILFCSILFHSILFQIIQISVLGYPNILDFTMHIDCPTRYVSCKSSNLKVLAWIHSHTIKKISLVVFIDLPRCLISYTSSLPLCSCLDFCVLSRHSYWSGMTNKSSSLDSFI